MNSHSIFLLFFISNLLFFPKQLISQTVNVTSPADSGGGSLRQAITDINAGSDASNTINMQVPGNSPIYDNKRESPRLKPWAFSLIVVKEGIVVGGCLCN